MFVATFNGFESFSHFLKEMRVKTLIRDLRHKNFNMLKSTRESVKSANLISSMYFTLECVQSNKYLTAVPIMENRQD